MSRTRNPVPGDRGSSIPCDPTLLVRDLREWAGEAVAVEGRKEALLGRVERLWLTEDGAAVEGFVRGNRPVPYQATVRAEEGDLESSCTCAAANAPACKHAVAVVEALRFPQGPTPRPAEGRRRQPRGDGDLDAARREAGILLRGGTERTLTRDERIALAGEDERSTRLVRARRSRQPVQLIEGRGPRRFLVGRADGRRHEVVLRDRTGAQATCGCADFRSAELSTCRHIERVLRWQLRKKKPEPPPRVSLWWKPREWVEEVPDLLQELRIDCTGPQGVPVALAQHIDADGWLAPPQGEKGALAAAREAVLATAREAHASGREWDLDPHALEVICRATADAARMEKLGAIDTRGGEWAGIQSRLKVDLHPYQRAGALFLARRGRAFLADDMGLGKTVQAIVAALLLQAIGEVQRILVVCPASLKHQWRRELEKMCGEPAEVVEGSPERRRRSYEAWRSGFLIVNYELLLRDMEPLGDGSADLVILDEAQRIKNWDTKTARVVKRLQSPYAFVLTGTPLENRLLELHSLAEFLHPRALGPRWRLLPYHAVTDPQGRVLAYEGLQTLRRRMSSFFLRRDRSTVLDQLPERVDSTYWTGMTLMQRRPYRKHAQRVAAIVGRGRPLPPGDVRALLQSLTSMRILCNSWAQYSWERVEERIRDPRPPDPIEIRHLHSPKLAEFGRVLEDILDEPGLKVVVFSQWERMLRLAHYVVRGLLQSRELHADVFHGGLASRARGVMLDRFRTEPEFRVLFSTDAGGVGLNLQEAASVVINLEVPWNPAVLEQRIGRVHRMGQRRSVQVLHFVTRGALEERVRAVLEGKRALFEGLLSQDADRIEFDERTSASFVERVMTLLH